jgi:hypothetical protein
VNDTSLEIRSLTIREALQFTGYKEIGSGEWWKPIGYQAFYYSEATNTWKNLFVNSSGKLAIWDSRSLNLESDCLVINLQEIETYTRTNFHYKSLENYLDSKSEDTSYESDISGKF